MRDFQAAANRLIDGNEKLITIAQAAKLMPAIRAGKSPTLNVTALLRWVLNGKRGVYLDAVRGPGKSWLTSREALSRFCAALSRAEAGEAEAVPAPAEADAELEERRRRAAALIERNRQARQAHRAAAR